MGMGTGNGEMGTGKWEVGNGNGNGGNSLMKRDASILTRLYIVNY